MKAGAFKKAGSNVYVRFSEKKYVLPQKYFNTTLFKLFGFFEGKMTINTLTTLAISIRKVV